MLRISLIALLVVGCSDDKQEVPVKHFEFEVPERIDASRDGPVDLKIHVEPHKKTRSLIRIRKDFTDEILKSVEDI